MNREDIIRMAGESGLPLAWISEKGVIQWEQLERFAALVAAAKDAEHQQTLALQQRSYEREIEIEVEAEREAIIQAMPGGHSVDPQWVCDMIRARSNT
jgi:hypothetical protein